MPVAVSRPRPLNGARKTLSASTTSRLLVMVTRSSGRSRRPPSPRARRAAGICRRRWWMVDARWRSQAGTSGQAKAFHSVVIEPAGSFKDPPPKVNAFSSYSVSHRKALRRHAAGRTRWPTGFAKGSRRRRKARDETLPLWWRLVSCSVRGLPGFNDLLKTTHRTTRDFNRIGYGQW